jgi:hypothetical protein
MTTGKATDRGYPVSVVLAQFRQVHHEIRSEVLNRSGDSLNWVPCSGANSVATIITHVLGSEAETVQTVAGTTNRRDRDAEFQMGIQDKSVLLGQIDAADALLKDLGSALTDERCAATMALPTLPSNDRRSGLTWLVGNLGHAREHMGHIRLTLQLHDVGSDHA